jgi:hypothetical protein
MSSPSNPDDSTAPTRSFEPIAPTRRFEPGAPESDPHTSDEYGQSDQPHQPSLPGRTDPIDPVEPANPIAPAAPITPANPANPANPGSIERAGLRMRTVVFGLILLIVAVMVLIGELSNVSIDFGAIVLAAMIGCGLLLVAGARRT